MDQKSFSILKKIIIPFLLTTFLFTESQSYYSNSIICEPQNCNNNSNTPIQYPFSNCDSPEFLTTFGRNYPFLIIYGYDDPYFILKVNNTTNPFTLDEPKVFPPSSIKCPVRGTRSTNNPNTVYLYFFYNCSKPYKIEGAYHIPSASTNNSFAVFRAEILDDPNTSCQPPDNSWALADYFDELVHKNYTHILNTAFHLRWNGVDCRSSSTSFCFCKNNTTAIISSGKSRNLVCKLVIGFGAAGGTAVVMCLGFCLYQRKQKKRQEEVALISHHSPSNPSPVMRNEKSGTLFGVHVFTYNDLEDATNKFDPNNIVGDGGFGTVYKGKLKDGRFIAVKRMYENNFRMVEQFLNEVEMLRRLRHRNLVTLYGCTSRHSRELLLVYEYISNGTVADHLHGDFAKPGSLPWITRMSIATETASALAYLHASDVIHRDVKTNNILLDNNFCVKVADFGLSRLFPTHVTHISTAPQGTPGYVDPEYYQCYHLTDRSDVFSFGVVLIELISSKPAVDITRHRHEINLSNMAVNKIQNDALRELVDPELGYESDEKVKTMIDAVGELSFRCLQLERDTRPSMDEVLKVLQDLQCENHGVDIEKKSKKKVMFSSTDTCIALASISTTSSTSVTL